MPYYLAEIDEVSFCPFSKKNYIFKDDELKMDIKSLVPYDINPMLSAEKIADQKLTINKLRAKLDEQVLMTKKYKKANDRLRQQNTDLVYSMEDLEDELEGNK